MSAADQPTPWEIVRAVGILRAAGIVVVLGSRSASSIRLMSREEVAEALGVSVSWVRAHEAEFPGRVKVPGGDVRIPVADVEAAIERWRAPREVAA